MKTFAHYDKAGAIVSVIGVDAPNEIEAMLEPDAGHRVAEIDDIGLKPGEPDVDAVRKRIDGYQVDVSGPPRGTLVRKP